MEISIITVVVGCLSLVIYLTFVFYLERKRKKRNLPSKLPQPQEPQEQIEPIRPSKRVLIF